MGVLLKNNAKNGKHIVTRHAPASSCESAPHPNSNEDLPERSESRIENTAWSSHECSIALHSTKQCRSTLNGGYLLPQ